MAEMPKARSLSANAVLLLFVLVQLCDGVLTYLGVHTFGASIEANPIVAWYIAAIGLGTGVVAIKAFAVGCAAILYWCACHRTLGLLTMMYLGLAVWPWAYLLVH